MEHTIITGIQHFGPELTMEQISDLYERAKAARTFSYSPYSKFAVGAALMGESGRIYLGCNIENGAYSPTNCAERTALFKAVSEGEHKFVRIGLIGGYTNPENIVPNCNPCGVCLQALSEFCDPDRFLVLMYSGDGSVRIHTLRELLPYGFNFMGIGMIMGG